MKELTSSYLRKKRKRLVARLSTLLEFVLRGSLVERYKRCGNPRCKCAQGPGHGPKYYLTISHPGKRPEMDYVPLDYHAKATAYLANFKKAKGILEEICQINRELLRRREKF